ncbi:replication initiation protein RepC (plasmid) [Rhizobium sp. T1470]|uniref:replication initiation protein RepC n=1 Tax=Rhizobium sp. T1470 TaxID=555320 RepID=UPI001AAE1DAB|nr:hypothetical protein [Rhizobium sp. T1473]
MIQAKATAFSRSLPPEKLPIFNSAGGYLRDLTTKARRGDFSVGPMLTALARTPAFGAKRAS